MFRHQGKSRTFKHNVQIAVVLSFVAGMVNASGFMAIQQLTTNVTGHFASLIHAATHADFQLAFVFFAYIFSFLLGSFSSGFLIEKFKVSKRLNVFVLPTLLEAFSLIVIALLGDILQSPSGHLIACLLLFAMGLQNSFVTKISNAVVRTTHLTGLFTDLGIELSQLFFQKSHPNRKSIGATIKLRIYIICFFFLGGLFAGWLYLKIQLQLNTLIVAAFILLASLFYDDLRFQIILTQRKYKQRRNQL